MYTSSTPYHWVFAYLHICYLSISI